MKNSFSDRNEASGDFARGCAWHCVNGHFEDGNSVLCLSDFIYQEIASTVSAPYLNEDGVPYF